MKTCKRCNKEKLITEFQKCSRNRDGATAICKECKRKYDNAHYKANPQRREYIRANSDARILEVRNWILDYFNSHPCIDCGEDDVVVLEFDHRGDKVGNISTMIHDNNLAKVKSEVAKCDVRCANCHRRKTAKDFGWWKLPVEV